jgi:hypothetical protein
MSMRTDKAAILYTAALFLCGLTLRAQAVVGEAGEASGQALKAGDGHPGNRDDYHAMLPPVTSPGDRRPLTGKERWTIYVRNAFWSPGVFFRAAGPALGAQLGNEPPSWGQGAEGYSKRFANRFGRFALKETYEAAGAAALGHEVRYVRSKRAGFLPRAAHALSANFVTYDRNGRRTPHVTRVGSVFAAEFTGNLWMPAGYRDASTALRGVGMELGAGAAVNLVREFAPELKRMFKRQ